MTTVGVITITISAFGGLALFLYGMTVLGNSLERISSGRMEKILENLTSNIFKSILLGMLVTSAIQSSSATTVIVVGLVNAGILKLSNAVGVIMGANIGTTVTGQLLRLGDLENNGNVSEIMNLLKPTTLAPFIAIIGILIYFTTKSDKLKCVGEMLLGFSILFTGMFAMEQAVSPLSEYEGFRNLFQTLSNPLLGVLTGAMVTALIQSSSASVGILQAISSTGVLKYSSAFPIIMGQNIGTCITSLLSSIGASKNAKRAAMVHLYFNVIGTLLFLIGVYSFQSIVGFKFWNESINRGGIANFHTIFNITVTIFFIPFHKVLEKLAILTIKNTQSDSENEISEATAENILDERFLKSPSLAIQQAFNAVVHMGKLAQNNFNSSVTLFNNYDTKQVEHIKEYENIIDRSEDKLNAYLVSIADCALTETESRGVTMLLHLTSEFERIGDYSINVVERAEMMNNKMLTFSEDALAELKILTDAVAEIIDMAVTCVSYSDMKTLKNIEPLEETVDYLCDTLKARHIERLKNSLCTIDRGIVFLDMLTDLERIADHCSNIAVYVLSRLSQKDVINKHEYIQNIHQNGSKEFTDALSLYTTKYKIMDAS